MGMYDHSFDNGGDYPEDDDDVGCSMSPGCCLLYLLLVAFTIAGIIDWIDGGIDALTIS